MRVTNKRSKRDKSADLSLGTDRDKSRSLFDSINDAILVIDPDSLKILDVNRKMYELWGYTFPEAISLTVSDISADDPVQSEQQALIWIMKARQGAPQLFEWRAKHKDGREFWVEMNISFARIDSQMRLLATARDISGRKLAEQVQAVTYRLAEVAQFAETLDDLYASIHKIIGELMPARFFFIALYDPATNVLQFPYHVDDMDEEWTPLTPGKSLTSYVLKTGKPLLATPEVFEELVRNGEVELFGTPSVDWLGVPMKNQHGETVGVIALQTYEESVRLREVDRDVLNFVSNQIAMVIERKKVEAELRESNNRFRLLFYQSPVGIFHYDTSLRITDCNDLIISILQRERKSLIGFDLNNIPDRNVLPAIRLPLEGTASEYEGAFHPSRSGEELWILMRTASVLGMDGKVAGGIGIIEDLTRRKHAESELFMDEIRLEALLRLEQMSAEEENKITQFSLEEAVRLTRSETGYLVFIGEEGSFDALYLLEREARSSAREDIRKMVALKGMEGLWRELLRSEGPIIQNQGLAELVARFPQPAGHIKLTRHLVVPVYGEKKIVALVGVVNKSTNYDEADVRQLSLLMQGMWRLVQRKKAEEAIRRHAAQAEALVRVAARLNSQIDLNILLKTVCEEAARALNVSAAWISLYDDGQDAFVLAESYGLPARFKDQFRPIAYAVFSRSQRWLSIPDMVPDIHEAVDVPNRELFLSLNIRPIAGVLLSRDNQLVGLLQVGNVDESLPYNENDLALLKGIGDQAAQAVLNTRLFANVQRHLKYEQALHEIDLAITGNTDLRYSLKVILKQAIEQLQVDAADILLIKHYSRVMEYAAGGGFKTRMIQDTRIRLEESRWGQALLERRLVQIPDLAAVEEDFGRKALVSSERFVTSYSAILYAKGQVKGVLEVFHRSALQPDQEWLDFLAALATQAAVAVDNTTLFENLQQSNAELALAYETTLEGWSKALDLRDKETEGHTLRVSKMTEEMGRKMGISESEIFHMRRGAILHDIGKMGIPDMILLKPGPLTPEEREIMHRHPTYAYELLWPINYLRPSIDIPYCHHERWDGTGYPRGLKEEQIPLAARMFALVDVWDALCSDRPYRKALERGVALNIMRGDVGAAFDPTLSALFFEMIGEKL